MIFFYRYIQHVLYSNKKRKKESDTVFNKKKIRDEFNLSKQYHKSHCPYVLKVKYSKLIDKSLGSVIRQIKNMIYAFYYTHIKIILP